MMKKRHILHWAMGMVMTPLLGSCASDDVSSNAGSNGCDLISGKPLAVTSVTRAADGGSAPSAFEADEEVWLWANKTDNTAHITAWHLKANSDGSSLTSVEDNNNKYWPSDAATLTFYALHGNFENNQITDGSIGWSGLSLTHSVKADQSSEPSRHLSDLLYATTTPTQSGQPVNLSFDHLLAKITVKLNLQESTGIKAEDFADGAEVSLLGIQPNAEFSSTDATNPTTDGDAINIITERITSLTESDLSKSDYYAGSAIIPAQTFTTGKELIQITFGGRTFKYRLNSQTEFKKGNEYTYTLKIIGKYVTGSLTSVTPFTENSPSSSFDDYFDTSVELKNRAYLGSAKAPHDLSYDYNGKVNTANCYVITHPGYYKFPLVYGNAIKDGETNASAYNGHFKAHDDNDISEPNITDHLTPHSASLVWQDAENLISTIALSSDKNYIQFEITNANIEQGNAVIAVKDGDGTIMWSWHIWVTDKNVYDTYTYGDYEFMPMALGQRKTNDGTTCTYYQWGRKDPFRETGHTTGDGSISQSVAIKNPTIFYKPGATGDWSSSSYNNGYDYWNAGNSSYSLDVVEVTKSIYDPSPVGFKVPPCYAFVSLDMSTNFTQATNGFVNSSNNDFWQEFGWLDGNGSLKQITSAYWSATPNSDVSNARCLDFASSYNYVQDQQTYNRVCGCPIRPIKDN